MHPDEERLPLACLPGATAFPPPLDCDEVSPYKKELPRALMSQPPASASTPTSGAVGASGDSCYLISPTLKPAYNALPALAFVPCLYQNVAYPQRHPFISRTYCYLYANMRRLIFYPLVDFVAHLVAWSILMSIALATLPRCASLHLWMRMHG